MRSLAISLFASFFVLGFGISTALATASPAVTVTSQVTCSSVAGVLVAAQPGVNHTVTIEQTGTTAFYIGPSTVTTSNGFLIPGVANSSYTISTSAPLYCVTASSTAAVTVIETLGN
jgi:hypothetical protein